MKNAVTDVGTDATLIYTSTTDTLSASAPAAVRTHKLQHGSLSRPSLQGLELGGFHMIQVTLVDQTGENIDPALLHHAAIALNVQVTRDLPTGWSGISASVSAAPTLASIPHGSWPVFLVKSLPPGEGGFHLDQHNQPFAKIIAAPSDQSWTVDASHEIIEMLVDPYGNRMHSSQAVKISGRNVVDADGLFNYLVEACDPCEANGYAYDIDGIAVSDFITSHFYDASATPGVKYSFRGNVERPRQLLPGGYISYAQPDGTWRQILWVNPDAAPKYNDLSVSGARSLRLRVHEAMGRKLDDQKHYQRRKPNGLPKPLQRRVAEFRKLRSETSRAALLRERYGLDEKERAGGKSSARDP